MQRNEREVIAFHEAGHATMAMALGYVVGEMSATPNEHGEGHVRLVAMTRPLSQEMEQRSRALFYLGGTAADFIHHTKWGQGSEDDVVKGVYDDHYKTRTILGEIDELDHFDAYVLMCSRFIGRAEVWAFVSQLSNMLMAAGSIDGQVYIARLAEVCPKFGPIEWTELELLKDRLLAEAPGSI